MDVFGELGARALRRQFVSVAGMFAHFM